MTASPSLQPAAARPHITASRGAAGAAEGGAVLPRRQSRQCDLAVHGGPVPSENQSCFSHFIRPVWATGRAQAETGWLVGAS